MTATLFTMDQGSTLTWTQSYGGDWRQRARDIFRDAAFALAVVALVAGVAGFVGYEKPAASTITDVASFKS